MKITVEDAWNIVNKLLQSPDLRLSRAEFHLLDESIALLKEELGFNKKDDESTTN